MATNKFRGDSQPVAQVTVLTVGGTFAIGQVYTVTVNRKDVSYTAQPTDANNNDVATGLAATLSAASTITEFTEAGYVASTNTVVCRASTAGVPFTISGVSASGTGTLGQSTTTASRGPMHWDDAENWSLNAVPVTGDDVWIERTARHIRYGLAQSGVTLASLNIPATYTGEIGLPEFNNNYVEYRDTYLTISATIIKIGAGEGGGSPRIQINTGTNATAVSVFKTGSPQNAGQPALWLRGSNAGNTLDVLKGVVGTAYGAGETAQFPTIRVGYTDSAPSDSTLYIGAGTSTVTTLNMNGGKVNTQANVTTATIFDGILTTLNSVTVGTCNGQKGKLFHQSNGTITTLTLGTGFTADFSRDLRTRTVTNCTADKGCTLTDSFKTVTFTNPISLNNCRLADVNFDLGSGILIQRT